MKYLISLLLIIAIATSCHKSQPTPSSGTALMCGLTGIKYKTGYDSLGLYVGGKYFTWNFKGTNPISAMPLSDSIYLGYEQMLFTGQRATSFSYNAGDSYYKGMSMTVNYNSADMPDTVTVTYPATVGGGQRVSPHSSSVCKRGC